jgi:hypothetical protein
MAPENELAELATIRKKSNGEIMVPAPNIFFGNLNDAAQSKVNQSLTLTLP